MRHPIVWGLSLALALASPSAWGQGAEDRAEDRAEPDGTEGEWPEYQPPATATPPDNEPAPRRQAPNAAAPAPQPSPRWWENHVPPPNDESARVPLAATGGALAGLGLVTLGASGIVWLTAWGESTRLDDECSAGVCVEGTAGGDAYQNTRGRARTAAILAGVGFPVLTGGLVLVAIGAASGERVGSIKAGPVITASQQGFSVEARF